ncbi:MAG TPA: mechanosensitive ion channel family protein [Candidatus Nanopelagicales bacterium]|nr:mechanosensitive ion channel family protein [Candidatus Nanopelagicales bacterium]
MNPLAATDQTALDLGSWTLSPDGFGAPLIACAVTVLALVVGYLVTVRVGNRFVRRMKTKGAESGARAETLWIVVRRVVLVVAILIGALLVLSFWGVSLTPFLAVGTIVGAAIGFGAQDLIRDLIAGFFILAEDQFHVGDTVQIADTTGTVEDIQFRVTVLRDAEGNVHFVPNGQITVTSNFTSVYARPMLDVAVEYGADVDRVLAVMGDELASLHGDPDWAARMTAPPVVLGVQELAPSAVLVRAQLTTVATERWAVQREARRRIKNRFDAEGIVMPFPQLTVHTDDR